MSMSILLIFFIVSTLLFGIFGFPSLCIWFNEDKEFKFKHYIASIIGGPIIWLIWCIIYLAIDLDYICTPIWEFLEK